MTVGVDESTDGASDEDALAGEWAFGPPNSVLMQVPQANEAARWLCAKMGYREGFRGPRQLVPAEDEPEAVAEAAKEADDVDPLEIFVTLGKRIGPVTWRLMAPTPPFD